MKEKKNVGKREKDKNEKKVEVKLQEVDLDKMLEKKKQKKEEKKEPNQGQKKPKKKLNKKTKIIIAVILLILLIGGAVFGYKVWKNGGGLKGTVVTVMGKDEKKLKDLPPLQFLLLGESQHMTDTIMICSYDPKTQEASMMSVPRDTFIGQTKDTARAADKINSRYQLGIDKTLKAINRVTGMQLEYYVVVDTDALVELVDAMGGVEFDVPIDMDYDDEMQDLYIHLKAGKQRLNGDQAEQLLRFRHNNNGSSYSVEYGDQDLGRMRTQREFIQEAFKQFFTIQNLLNINKFIDIAEKSIKTNLDFATLKDYVPYAVDFQTENLATGVLPGTPEKCNEVWLYIVNKKEATELITELFGEDAIKSPIQTGNALSGKTNTTTKNTTVDEPTTTNTTKPVNNTNKNTTVNTVTEPKPTNTVVNETKPTTTTNQVEEPISPKNDTPNTNTTQAPTTPTTTPTTNTTANEE